MAWPRRFAASLRLAGSQLFFFLGSPTRGHRPLDSRGPIGKSETCRASAWQSQKET